MKNPQSTMQIDVGRDARRPVDAPRTFALRTLVFISSPNLAGTFMLRIAKTSFLLGGSLLALGCEQQTARTSTAPTPVQATADRKAAEAKVQNKEAFDATLAAAQAKRDEYAVVMRKQLDELDVKYAELEQRAAKAEGEMKKELDKKAAEAKVKRNAAAVKLEELKTASADRWEKIKDGVGNAVDDLKKAFE